MRSNRRDAFGSRRHTPSGSRPTNALNRAAKPARDKPAVRARPATVHGYLRSAVQRRQRWRWRSRVTRATSLAPRSSPSDSAEPGDQRVEQQSRHHHIATRSALHCLSHHSLGKPGKPWRLVRIGRHVNAGRVHDRRDGPHLQRRALRRRSWWPGRLHRRSFPPRQSSPRALRDEYEAPRASAEELIVCASALGSTTKSPGPSRRVVPSSRARCGWPETTMDPAQRTVESQSPFTPQQQRTEARAVEPELAQHLAQQVDDRGAAVLDGGGRTADAHIWRMPRRVRNVQGVVNCHVKGLAMRSTTRTGLRGIVQARLPSPTWLERTVLCRPARSAIRPRVRRRHDGYRLRAR